MFEGNHNQTKGERVKGIARSKFSKLLEAKEKLKSKSFRFDKESLSEKYQIDSLNSSKIKAPLVQMSSLKTMPSMPPEWLHDYEQCEQLILDLTKIRKQMMGLQSKRISCIREADQQNMDQKIYSLATNATKKIKQCQRILQAIEREIQSGSKADQNTCKNICFRLATDIRDQTKEIRAQQRAYIQQRQQIDQTQKPSFLQLAAEKVLDYDDQQLEQEQIECEDEEDLSTRNQELLKLIESVHELNDIYKELQDLVIMQGSLMDRIDLNFEESHNLVKQGDIILEKGQKWQKKTSKCSRGMIIVLLLAICVLGIILGARWS